jgi:transposase
VLADIAAKARDPRVTISPVALEAVKRIDAIFEIEREINGAAPDIRRAIRQARSKALHYMPARWDAFARFVEDGRICISNNAAERAMRAVAPARKSRLFAGSDRGGDRAAVIYALIYTAKLNDVDPQGWLADVLARIAEHPIGRLDELLPWNRKRPGLARAAEMAA